MRYDCNYYPLSPPIPPQMDIDTVFFSGFVNCLFVRTFIHPES